MSSLLLGCAHKVDYRNYVGDKPSEKITIKDKGVERVISVGPLTLINEPPLKQYFLAIYSETYVFGHYDCTNKSAKYARILKCHGYNPILLITGLDDSFHCIVSVEVDGKEMYIDVTDGESSFEYDESMFGVKTYTVAYPEWSDQKVSKGAFYIDRGAVDWRCACEACD